ncbi:MAG TPA: universal stress protein [Afifellaceae bacterium]|nr:universal stress protein [Afifellaceae bacterium]
MYRSILLPLDLEHENSWRKALPVARGLADAFAAELHLLVVVPVVSQSYVGQFFPADYQTQLAAEVEKQLRAFARERLGEAAVGLHVAHGRISDEILAAAERLGCDLIVMASHRPRIADYLIGPFAAHVVGHSRKSVLVVRD